MKIVAIDHGEKRIGLAVSDADGRMALALPLHIVEKDADDVARLAAAVREQDPERVVVGLPLNMDGTEGPAVERVREFVGELRGHLDVPIDLHDERLTSEEAARRLRGAPMSRDRRRGHTNTVAAQILLESYLAEKKS